MNLKPAQYISAALPASCRCPWALGKRLIWDVYECNQDPPNTSENMYIPTAKPMASYLQRSNTAKAFYSPSATPELSNPAVASSWLTRGLCLEGS